MTGFAQIIEWKSSRIDEIEQLMKEWRERHPEMGPSRILVAADKDNANSYVTVVEFESYEAAMKNSEDPATSEFSERMGALLDGPPRFRNLDVTHLEERK